jgi:hypothetical protein
MMSAHCVRVQRVTELPVLASLTIAQAVHRLAVRVVHASLMIGRLARVVKMAPPLVPAAPTIDRRAQEAIAIVRHAQEATAIVHRVRAVQMIVRRAREVLMSARPVAVAQHSVDQQKVVAAQVKVAVVRARVVVVQQKDAVAQVKAVVVQLLVGQQKVAVVRSVKMIVQ